MLSRFLLNRKENVLLFVLKHIFCFGGIDMKKKFLIKAAAAVMLLTPVTGSFVIGNTNTVLAKNKTLKVKDIKKPVRNRLS